MSDILIKGMEMPKRCGDCNFYYTDYEEGTATCLATSCYVTPRQYNKGNRDSGCPLVEIPTPHGRLIDCERATFPTAFRYNTNDYAKGWNACIKAVQTAPTIIEAEVSE